ncbi:uncharacterized protein LOC117118821 [Anneissia japonica]|uniref:uncharacterized protein LOC117118821 n=1 Tax=Anneissia japonica TaxID=1529436 RepID=UPI0014256347|nr:uncharacterized protein LOC117118821 [Anneissia japonica]
MAVNSRKRSAADIWNWNGTPVADFGISTTMPNGFHQVSPKRKCNGLLYTNQTTMLPMAPVYQKHEEQQQFPEQLSMHVDEDMHEEGMDTQTMNTEDTKKNNVCARCLAGEPGHIMHILG